MLDAVKLTLLINQHREGCGGEVEGAETHPGKTWEDDQEPF